MVSGEENMGDMLLRLDARRRISLAKLLPVNDIEFVQASTEENGNIVLKPMTVIPAHEKWLYDNPEALKKLKRGLSQKGTIDRGSFSQYIDD